VVQKFSHDPFFMTRPDDVLEKRIPDVGRCPAVVSGRVINVYLYRRIRAPYLRDYRTAVIENEIYHALPRSKQM